MELLQSINALTTAQLEFFSVAALLTMTIFSGGFVLGRSSKSKDVKVPLEVIHALASARVSPRMDAAAPKADSKEDKIEDEIEHLLDHVEHHEKDFAHAKAHTLHELDRIIHDYGATPDLGELHKKVEHTHNIPEIVAALKWYITRHHH
ncbi:MAG: hypothetical protein ABL973_11885 [Micropepsaceae bacterium]